MGTPRYMAPEAIRGEKVDARSDLFAAGAILFEMLSGRPAFDGRTMADVIHATRLRTAARIQRLVDRGRGRSRDSSGALQAAVGSLPSAEVMAEELRWAGGWRPKRRAAQAHALTRLVVLPFRILRPDAGDRLSRLQPARRDHDVALRHRIADRPLERGGRALCRRHAGSQGARHRCQRRSRRHGHAAAVGRSDPRGGAAGRSARRHGADLAHGAGHARRSVPSCRTTSRGAWWKPCRCR